MKLTLTELELLILLHNNGNVDRFNNCSGDAVYRSLLNVELIEYAKDYTLILTGKGISHVNKLTLVDF